MKFDYFKFLLPQRSDFFGHAVLKPVIPIRVGTNSRSMQYDALVDSGADFSIFHAEVGDALGLNIKDGYEIKYGGVQEGSPATAYVHKIILTVGGWKYETMAGFSDSIAERSYGILGQKGFFDIFTVKFDLIKEEVELKERK